MFQHLVDGPQPHKRKESSGLLPPPRHIWGSSLLLNPQGLRSKKRPRFLHHIKVNEFFSFLGRYPVTGIVNSSPDQMVLL